jgi:hypothetical protein
MLLELLLKFIELSLKLIKIEILRIIEEKIGSPWKKQDIREG